MKITKARSADESRYDTGAQIYYSVRIPNPIYFNELCVQLLAAHETRREGLIKNSVCIKCAKRYKLPCAIFDCRREVLEASACVCPSCKPLSRRRARVLVRGLK